eukprot:20602-Heterococcus_DN1.PRE.2
MSSQPCSKQRRGRSPRLSMSVTAYGVQHTGITRDLSHTKSSRRSQSLSRIYARIGSVLLSTLCYYAAARLGLMITLEKISLFWSHVAKALLQKHHVALCLQLRHNCMSALCQELTAIISVSVSTRAPIGAVTNEAARRSAGDIHYSCQLCTDTFAFMYPLGVIGALVVARIGVTPSTLGIQLGLCNALELVIGGFALKRTMRQVLKVVALVCTCAVGYFDSAAVLASQRVLAIYELLKTLLLPWHDLTVSRRTGTITVLTDCVSRTGSSCYRARFVVGGSYLVACNSGTPYRSGTSGATDQFKIPQCCPCKCLSNVVFCRRVGQLSDTLLDTGVHCRTVFLLALKGVPNRLHERHSIITLQCTSPDIAAYLHCNHNSAITDAWTVVVIVYSVLSDDNRKSWTIGGTSNDVIATTVVMHTTLFLSVLTTQFVSINIAAKNRALINLQTNAAEKLAFFQHMSHEFKTPLSVIVGFTEELMQYVIIARHIRAHFCGRRLQRSSSTNTARCACSGPVAVHEQCECHAQQDRCRSVRPLYHVSMLIPSMDAYAVVAHTIPTDVLAT